MAIKTERAQALSRQMKTTSEDLVKATQVEDDGSTSIYRCGLLMSCMWELIESNPKLSAQFKDRIKAARAIIRGTWDHDI